LPFAKVGGMMTPAMGLAVDQNKEERLIVRRHLSSTLIGFFFASALFSQAAAQPAARS